MSKSFQIWNHFFSLLFLDDSENLKCLDIGLCKVGAKRPLNSVRKCDGQIYKHTYWHFNLYKESAQRADSLKKLKLKLQQNSTQSVSKLRLWESSNWICDKTKIATKLKLKKRQTQILKLRHKLKNWNCDKTQMLTKIKQKNWKVWRSFKKIK